MIALLMFDSDWVVIEFVGIWLWVILPSRRKLGILACGRALAWLGDAVSMTEVARRLQVSHSVIQRLQGWFRATGRVTEQPPSGRPRCTSTQDDHFLYLSTLRDRSIASTTLRRQLMSVVHVNVSPSTIHSRLHEAGLHSRSAEVRNPLTLPHCRALQCGDGAICTGAGSSCPESSPQMSLVSPLPSTTAGHASGAGSESASFETLFGNRMLWRRTNNGVGRPPPQRHNTPLHHPGLPNRRTLQGRDCEPPHLTCSAGHGKRRHSAA